MNKNKEQHGIRRCVLSYQFLISRNTERRGKVTQYYNLGLEDVGKLMKLAGSLHCSGTKQNGTMRLNKMVPKPWSKDPKWTCVRRDSLILDHLTSFHSGFIIQDFQIRTRQCFDMFLMFIFFTQMLFYWVRDTWWCGGRWTEKSVRLYLLNSYASVSGSRNRLK